MIVGVDPGTMTGFSGASSEDGTLLFADQLPAWEFCDWLFSWVQAEGPALHLVVERFTISMATAKKAPAGSHDALGVIGVCRWLSLRWCERDILMSQPAEVMRLISNDRLKAMGWYQRGKPHACDSLRHLAARCAQLGLVRLPHLP